MVEKEDNSGLFFMDNNTTFELKFSTKEQTIIESSPDKFAFRKIEPGAKVISWIDKNGMGMRHIDCEEDTVIGIADNSIKDGKFKYLLIR